MSAIIYLLGAALFSVAFFYLTWYAFMGVMTLYRGKRAGVLPPETEKLAKPGLWFAYVLDFLSNILATIVFLDIPRDPLVTDRLQRYVDGPDTWRRRLAILIDSKLLAWADPKGYHVRMPDSQADK